MENSDEFIASAKKMVAPMLIQFSRIVRTTTGELELVENLLIRAYCDGALDSMKHMRAIYQKEVIKDANDQ